MTQENINIVNALVRSDSWKLIDQIIDAHIQRLDSIAQVDRSMSAEDIKIQLEARTLAMQTLHDILLDLRGYGVEQKPTSPITRSWK